MNNQNYNGYNNQQPYNQGQPQQPQYNQYQQYGGYSQQPNQTYQQPQPQMQPSSNMPNSNQSQTGHGANMIQAIILFFTHYLDFKSKSTRSEWWWTKLWELIYLIVGMILLTVTGASSVISTLATSGLKGAGFVSSLFGFGFVGILMLLINLGICIPFLALRTRRFNDAGLPFIVSAGINIARVVCFWLAKFVSFFGILFGILMLASFILELLPSKNKGNSNQQSTNDYNTMNYNQYQPNVAPQMTNNYNQPNMATQQNQYQQPNGYQQPQNNQSYQQPQQPYNQYQ